SGGLEGSRPSAPRGPRNGPRTRIRLTSTGRGETSALSLFPLALTTGAVYTTPMEPDRNLRPTLRQDVFNAAIAAGLDAKKADQIASNLSEARRKGTSNFSVPDDTRE